MNKMSQRGFAVIPIIIVIVILAGVAGYFGLVRKQHKVATSPTLSAKITKDETASWKTYRNREFHLELKYPGFYTKQLIEVEVDKKKIFPPLVDFQYWSDSDNDYIGVFTVMLVDANKSKLSLSKWFRKKIDQKDTLLNNGDYFLTKLKNGGEAYQVFSEAVIWQSVHDTGRLSEAYIMPKAGGPVFSLQLSLDLITTELVIDKFTNSRVRFLNQIIPTFKFLK